MEIVLDVSALIPDLATVDALARLQRRQLLRLRGASTELRELIVFCGLADVLAVERSPTRSPTLESPHELGGER